MPPYPKTGIVWNNVHRQVEAVQDSTTRKWTVVLTFTKIGYDMESQQRVEELAGSTVLASKLSAHAADDLKRTVEDACSQSYAQGYTDGRKH